jgi:hypothetical protein
MAVSPVRLIIAPILMGSADAAEEAGADEAGAAEVVAGLEVGAEEAGGAAVVVAAGGAVVVALGGVGVGEGVEAQPKINTATSKTDSIRITFFMIPSSKFYS